MKRDYFHYSLFSFCMLALTPLAAFFDRVSTIVLTAMDFVMPFTEMAYAGVHPMRPTREVTYLTRGIHRMAQNILRRGPNGDDGEPAGDDGEDITRS